MSGMAHSHSGGMVSMPVGVPGLFHMQRIFWAFVGTAIGVATIANILNKLLYHQRLSSLRTDRNAAKPKTLFFQAHATLSAVIRESTYYSIPLSIRNTRFYLPPAGPVMIMVAYIVLIVVCSFYRLDTTDFLQWEDIGYRSGFIAVAQLPLIVLLSGKRNIIGFLTGVGYERLCWLHRWVARALLFTVLIHMGFWLTEWGKFDYIGTKVKTDALTRRGIVAGSVLLWIAVSSVGPIRGVSYQIFVVQHIGSWIGLLIAIWFHVPQENRIWIWLPLGFWAFDRFVRALSLAYNNVSLFHKDSRGLLACKATFEPLDDYHTRITIVNPTTTWKAGQHMFLSCHPLAPLSSHPFTISSLPEDGKMEFVIRAQKGATKKFFKYAEKIHPSLPSSSSGQNMGRSVLIEGPYACIRPLRQFDSLVFVAGSTGATFTMPLMRDIVQQWTSMGIGSTRQFGLRPPAGAVTRHIRFIWAVKRQASVSWFASQLDQVVKDVEVLRSEGQDISVDISIYITCDDTLTSGQSRGDVSRLLDSNQSEKEAITTDAQEVSSKGSLEEEGCCCTRVITDEDAITSPCNCASRKLESSSSGSLQKNRLVDARISVLSGRPDVSNVIRKTAETALGEMAVVVCGPPGLVQCTRNSAVAISDDRAVHKGTSAQGIYCHAETFGYA